MTETANVNTATADAGSTRGKLRDTDRGRTLPAVLAAGVGAAVAGVAMVPNTGSIPHTLALFIGICAGGLLSAAMFLALFGRRRNRWLVSSAASEDARNRSEAHARAVIDNAVDAIAIIDANGIITSFNRAAYRMFGYEPHEVIGSNVSMLMPEPHRTRHDAYIHHYITTAEPRIIGIGRELDARRRDGTAVPIHLSVSEVVVHGQRTFTGVMRDISIERADKEEIRRQNERLSVTVRNAPMGIVTYQFGEAFASTNRAFETMIGYSNAELEEMEFVSLTHPEDRAELKRLTDDAHSGRIEHFSLRLRLLQKSGTPTHDQHGVPDLVIVQVEDLTAEMMAKEAERVHQDRLTHVARLSTLGEMTAAIAHEINQPLTAISMYAQSGVRMLDAGIPKPERLREALEKLSAQSLRAGAVIDRVQRLVRKQESKFETVRINDLIGDILRLAESDARVNDMQIALDLARDVAEVNADPIQIQQVLLNLIRNAIDAMRSIDCRHGRVVTIRSRAVSGYRVEVSVVDSGTGIADDLVAAMFTPFSTTKPNGMGMGLSICRSIIDAHGGQLSYRNNPDHGATFYFQLPIGQSHEI
jgi:two-component system, LuxR family, sensor kinase FixL